MSTEDSSFTLPDGFDPRYQVLNYTSIAGTISLQFADLDWYMHILLRNAIIYGARIGACGLAIITLFIVSKNKKSPVFFLNQIILLMVVIHSAFYFTYLFSQFASITLYFTGFSDMLVSRYDLNIYAATNFFHFFTIICIEISMVFQVKTIFQSPEQKWLSRGVVGFSGVIALSTIVLCLFVFVKSVISTFQNEADSYSSQALNAYPILFASSVNFMSILLIAKLMMAVKSRRYLGLKQFDGFHILLIMSTQTLIIPSIVLIVSYACNALARLAFLSICTALVALSLPLSSMWASSANNSASPTSSGFHTYTPSGRGTSYFSEPGTATLKVDSQSAKLNTVEYDPEKSLYTPSTAAEDEARRYWMNDDNDLDGEDYGVVGRTTHQLNARSS